MCQRVVRQCRSWARCPFSSTICCGRSLWRAAHAEPVSLNAHRTIDAGRAVSIGDTDRGGRVGISAMLTTRCLKPFMMAMEGMSVVHGCGRRTSEAAGKGQRPARG